MELAGDGMDTVQALVGYSLPTNAEYLTLEGSTDIDGTGNALANIIIGNSAKSALKGMAGNDSLDSGAGADVLEGGKGNDTYIVDARDVVTELGGEGTNTVQVSVNFTLLTNVEKLILTGGGNLDGAGNQLANTLTGNAGKNLLQGLDGNDTLDGGKGADTLEGGLGNDTYIVDKSR